MTAKYNQTVYDTFYNKLSDTASIENKVIQNIESVVDIAMSELVRLYKFELCDEWSGIYFDEFHERLVDYIRNMGVIDFGTIANINEVVLGVSVIIASTYHLFPRKVQRHD